MDKNTPKGKGFRTAYQAVAGVVVAYLYGLWQLPGVSDYTVNFLRDQGIGLLFLLAGLVGIPAGIVSYLQNKKNK